MGIVLGQIGMKKIKLFRYAVEIVERDLLSRVEIVVKKSVEPI